MLNLYQTYHTKKINLSGSVYLFKFSLIEPKEINFLAGQYLILLIPFDNKNIFRLYSIASSPGEKNSFELVVELVEKGVASTYLKNLKIGDKVLFKGPAGMFTLKENNKNKIFFATGTGIAPIKSMIFNTQNSKIKSQNQYQSFLFWGLRKKQDVYFLEEFKKIAKEDKSFQFKICLSKEDILDIADNYFFSLGHIDEVFEKEFYSKLKNSIDDYEFYLCGGRNLIESLKQFLLKKNIPSSSIFFEKF